MHKNNPYKISIRTTLAILPTGHRPKTGGAQ